MLLKRGTGLPKIKKIMDETAREIYPAFLWNIEIRIETANGIRK